MAAILTPKPARDKHRKMSNNKVMQKETPYLMLALDHRQSFFKLMNPQNPNLVTPKQVTQLKKEFIECLSELFTGVLIDVELGLQALHQAFEGQECPLFLLPIEKSGFKAVKNYRVNEKLYDVAKLKAMGASGVKLLLYFDYKASQDVVMQQLKLAKESVEQAHASGLPLFLEIVTYNNTTNTVVEAVQMFLAHGIVPDVFKLEFAGNQQRCAQITQVLGKTPWILLTRGDDFAEFSQNLQLATAAGAKGFLAGRALWKEICAEKDSIKRQDFYKHTLIPRFKEISDIARSGF